MFITYDALVQLLLCISDYGESKIKTLVQKPTITTWLQLRVGTVVNICISIYHLYCTVKLTSPVELFTIRLHCTCETHLLLVCFPFPTVKSKFHLALYVMTSRACCTCRYMHVVLCCATRTAQHVTTFVCQSANSTWPIVTQHAI